MNNSVKKQIINMLSTDNYVTASTIAKKLNVSTRTVNNYINIINFNKTVILSNKRYGYKLISDYRYEEDKIPSSQEERVFYLIKALVKCKQGISILDLSEQLCISTSTLIKDFPTLREKLSNYDLKLKNRKGYLYLLGDEEDKRRLIRELIINQNTDIWNYSLELFNNSEINQDEIKDILISLLKNYNIYISDYSLNNILIHSIITIYRLINNNYLENEQNLDFEGFDLQLKVAEDFARQLEKKYRIKFNQNEINQLAFLLITKTTTVNFNELDLENVIDLVGEEYYKLAQEIIEKVHCQYFIDIYDTEFLLKFSLHLKNMLFRAKNKYQEKNPLTQEFKSSYPLIYDIAAFVCSVIQEKKSIYINEDEITYLSFHLGSIIERKNQMSHKLKCIFVYDNYYDYYRETLLKITRRFGEYLEVTDVVNSSVEFQRLDYDIIISLVPLHLPDVEYVLINKILMQRDYDKILKKIETTKKKNSLGYVVDYLDDFFKEYFFEIEHYFINEFEAIKYMTYKLIEKEYVDRAFMNDVLKREKITSTSFDNGIAIPHSMAIYAKRNCAYVIINSKPMQWGNHPVKLIILIGISEKNRSAFKDLYSKLLEILDEPEYLKQVLACNSYETMIKTLKNNMKNI